MSTEIVARPPAQPPAGPVIAQPPVPAGGTGTPTGTGGQLTPRPTSNNLPANLSVFSVLDMIGHEMSALDTSLAALGEQLVPLDKTAAAIDVAVTIVDERSQEYEAPLATRNATDAASSVGAQMADMSTMVRHHTYRAQELNAAAFLALQTMRDVQDSQRAMGAGSRLLRDAGR